jgi:hypothetical protein
MTSSYRLSVEPGQLSDRDRDAARGDSAELCEDPPLPPWPGQYRVGKSTATLPATADGRQPGPIRSTVPRAWSRARRVATLRPATVNEASKAGGEISGAPRRALLPRAFYFTSRASRPGSSRLRRPGPTARAPAPIPTGAREAGRLRWFAGGRSVERMAVGRRACRSFEQYAPRAGYHPCGHGPPFPSSSTRSRPAIPSSCLPVDSRFPARASEEGPRPPAPPA